MRKFLFAALIATAATTAAFAGPFENGAAAYKRGDWQGAMNAWHDLAATDPMVQNNIGIMYKDGKGVRRDNAMAVQWLSRSASGGNSFGQNNLGGMYRDGLGVKQDYARAITFFRAAAQQGNGGAQVNLGLMLAKGEGTKVDMVSAYMWFDLAAQSVPQAVSYRSQAAARMSRGDVTLASVASQRCRQANYKNCAV